MPAGSLDLQVTASVDEFRAQMSAAGGAARDAAGQMRGAFQGTQPAVSTMTQGIDRAQDALRSHLAHTRGVTRASNLFARELTTIGIASGESAQAIAHLAAGFAMGGVWGAAIAGAVLLAHEVFGVGESAQKAAETAVAALSKIGDEAHKIASELAGKTPEEETEERLQTVNGLIARRNELLATRNQAQRDSLRGLALQSAEEVEAGRNAVQTLKDAKSELKGFYEVLRTEAGRKIGILGETPEEIDASLARLGSALEKLRDIQTAKAAVKAGTDQNKLAEEQLAESIRRTEAEYARFKEESRRFDERQQEDVERAEKEQMAWEDKRWRQMEEEAERGSRAMNEHYKAMTEEAERDADHLAKSIARPISSMLADVITGTRSITEALRALFNQLLTMVIEMGVELVAKQIANAIIGTAAAKAEAISATQGHIAVATAGAAASQAFIPFVGPALAAAAASSMAASLEAVTAPMLAAQRGFDIPAGLNPVVQAHAREMILPRELAEGIRALVAGGARRAPGSVNLYAWDAATARRQLRRNRGALAREMVDLARDRRSS